MRILYMQVSHCDATATPLPRHCHSCMFNYSSLKMGCARVEVISYFNFYFCIVEVQLTTIQRPELQDISVLDDRKDGQHMEIETELQDTSTSTNRPTSILSDSDSSQRYESIDGSDEEYTFVTAPTTPAERPDQQYQNPLPLLTDVSSRLRSIQASHSPPQPVYSYCDVLPSAKSRKSDNRPHHSTNGHDAGGAGHGGCTSAPKPVNVETKRMAQPTLRDNNQKNRPESKNKIPAVSVTITSNGIELKLSSSPTEPKRWLLNLADHSQ